MHMAFLSRGFKNLQWYSMTRCIDKKMPPKKIPHESAEFFHINAVFDPKKLEKRIFCDAILASSK